MNKGESLFGLYTYFEKKIENQFKYMIFIYTGTITIYFYYLGTNPDTWSYFYVAIIILTILWVLNILLLRLIMCTLRNFNRCIDKIKTKNYSNFDFNYVGQYNLFVEYLNYAFSGCIGVLMVLFGVLVKYFDKIPAELINSILGIYCIFLFATAVLMINSYDIKFQKTPYKFRKWYVIKLEKLLKIKK
ncbi:hypothetical protein [Methanococcus maripaludis]|uniref:Uncharacterized protein n=2 Tax=Methanococcus maripaludis TaxID=39152 RepID=A0A7J9PJP3_METMI|nr:hypothetical protein [Methanococcus maripaludis]MBA2862900.1 hypothetical protein [Methanococcus maripaludis]